VNACLCCVRCSFFHPSQEIGVGKRLRSDMSSSCLCATSHADVSSNSCTDRLCDCVCRRCSDNRECVSLFVDRDNLEWLARATNWAKFTATASLGAIHKVRLMTAQCSTVTSYSSAPERLPVAHQMVEVEHYFFLRSHGSRIIKKAMLPKFEPLRSLMTPYFRKWPPN